MREWSTCQLAKTRLRVYGAGSGVYAGLSVQGSRFRVSVFGPKAQGLGVGVQGLRARIPARRIPSPEMLSPLGKALTRLARGDRGRFN